MAESTEGQVDVSKEFFEKEYLQENLKNVTDILGISNPKYRINLATNPGDNYVGIVYRVFIDGEKNGVPIKTSTIFKVPPKDESTRLKTQAAALFEREHFFYSTVVPIIKDFLTTKNRKLETIARCYFSSATDHKEVICLEDLRQKGFEMRDRLKQMDFAHASLAFRTLGRLHALSFAMRDQKPERFASKVKTLKEALFRPEVIADELFTNRIEKLGKIVTTIFTDEDSRYTSRFSEFVKNIPSHMQRSCDGSIAEPYAVLCHGDFSMNNMLFKYGKDKTKPQDMYLVDFQISRYTSPATDISYILYCNCNQELRNRHFDELIKIYHKSLTNYLMDLGSAPNRMFPYEALLAQLKKFSIYGAAMTLLVLPAFTSQGEDVPKSSVEDVDVPRMSNRIQRDFFLRDNLRDSFKDLIDRNYI